MRCLREVVFFLILLILALIAFSCKNVEKNEKKETITLINENLEVIDEETAESGFRLEYLQGVWKSYSYYLEHEGEDKDEHVNEYYKIVVDNKCLDIILKHHVDNDMMFKTYTIGFADSCNLAINESSLRSKGTVLVRIHNENYYEGRIEDVKVNKVENSMDYSSDIDMYETFEDGFEYRFVGGEEKEKVQYRKINALPHSLFKALKDASTVYGVDFIQKFKIAEISKQVEVIKSKVYFYNEMNEGTKRKAFLIKSDLAYMESFEEEWVKIYYDGNVITDGFVRIEDVKIVE